MHENLEVLFIHKTIPITPDLREARVIDSINEAQFAANVVMDTIDGLLKPPSQVPSEEASGLYQPQKRNAKQESIIPITLV